MNNKFKRIRIYIGKTHYYCHICYEVTSQRLLFSKIYHIRFGGPRALTCHRNNYDFGVPSRDPNNDNTKGDGDEHDIVMDDIA